MLNSEDQRLLFVREIGKWIPVPLELHKEYYREVSSFRSKQRYHGRCWCPRNKWWICNTDCQVCNFRAAGGPLSLDAEIDVNGEGDTITLAEMIPDPTESIEEKIIQSETLDALHRELERLSLDDQRICELVMKGKSQREGARILGLSRSTYRRRLKKTMAGLLWKLGDKIER